MGMIGNLFGISPSKIVNTDGIKRTHNHLSSITQDMLSSTRREYLQETFEEAIERQNLTEDILAKRRFQLVIESRMFYALFVVSQVLFFYFAYQGNYTGLIPSLCGLVIGGSGGLTRAFRIHQIDKRELFGFNSFLKDPEGWIK